MFDKECDAVQYKRFIVCIHLKFFTHLNGLLKSIFMYDNIYSIGPNPQIKILTSEHFIQSQISFPYRTDFLSDTYQWL